MEVITWHLDKIYELFSSYFYIMKKVFKFLGDALLRFYTEIIAGIWMVITFIPLDCFLYTRITGKPSYPLYGKTLHYFTIFYIFYTIFFLSSAILVPLIRRKRLCNTLKRFERSKQITYVQRKKIFNGFNQKFMKFFLIIYLWDILLI